MNDLDGSRATLDGAADAGRWADLLAFAADASTAPPKARLEAARLLALEAPAPLAAGAADLFPDENGASRVPDPDGAGPDPLWEIVAQRPWRELGPHLRHPRVRHLVAQTRALHGEDLSGVVDPEPGPPLALEPWEAAEWDPEWDITEYARHGSSGSTLWAFPPEATEPLPPSPPADRVDHPALPLLADLADGAYVVRGTAWQAAAQIPSALQRTAEEQAVRHGRTVRFTDAYPHLMHLAAGNGFSHRTVGQAIGRATLWAALGAMAGDPDPRAVTAFVQRLHCVGWRWPGETLFHHNLAMADPEQGIAWAITAWDSD